MANERRRFWLWTGAALFAGFFLRLWFIVHYPRIAGDSLVYGDLAKTWMLHGVYGFTEAGRTAGSVMFRPTLIRLPGYPLFLAVCFRLFGMEHYRAVLDCQLAADLLTCTLAAALARRLFGPRAFLPVLWLAALCPFTSNYVAAPLTEALVLTTIALAFYAFARWLDAGARFNRWLWVLAATLAYSILLRPDQGLLTAAILPLMLWSVFPPQNPEPAVEPGAPSFSVSSERVGYRAKLDRPSPGTGATPAPRRLRASAPIFACALSILIPFLPWTIRNARTFHVFQPLAPRSASDPGEQPPSGFNRWYRTWSIEFASTDAVYWNYDGNVIDLAQIPTRAFALGCRASPALKRQSQPLYAATASVLADYNEETSSTPALDARFDALARRRIRAAPLCYYLAMPAARLLNMLFRPRTEMLPIPVEWWKFSTRATQRAFAAAYAALNLAYFALAFFGLRRGWMRNPTANTRILLAAMALNVILRCALLLNLDNSEARYTLELFPILFVFAGGLFTAREESGVANSS